MMTPFRCHSITNTSPLISACATGICEYPKNTNWMMDSGCTVHITFEIADLLDYTELEKPLSCELPGGGTSACLGYGTVKGTMFDGKKQRRFVLNNVFYVPAFKERYISVNKLEETHIYPMHTPDGVLLRKGNDVIAIAAKQNGQYWLQLNLDTPGNTPSDTPSVHSIKATKASLEKWHYRLGHASYSTLNMIKNQIHGFILDEKSKGQPNHPCRFCAEGKQRRYSFPPSQSRAKNILDLIHMDLVGPMQTSSIQRNSYFLGIIDDKSGYSSVYFLSTKDQAFEKFKVWKEWAENQLGRKLKKIRTDGGGEFVNHEFQAYLEENGIEHQKSAPRSAQQNGRAERWNQTQIGLALAMILHAGLSPGHWQNAVAYACTIYNLLPKQRHPNYASPYEIWKGGKKPDISFLRIFGCLAYVHTPKALRHKFGSHAIPMTFVGLVPGTKGYLMWDRKTRKLVTSRDVIFDESAFPARPETMPKLSFELAEHIQLEIPLEISNPFPTSYAGPTLPPAAPTHTAPEPASSKTASRSQSPTRDTRTQEEKDAELQEAMKMTPAERAEAMDRFVRIDDEEDIKEEPDTPDIKKESPKRSPKSIPGGFPSIFDTPIKSESKPSPKPSTFSLASDYPGKSMGSGTQSPAIVGSPREPKPVIGSDSSEEEVDKDLQQEETTPKKPEPKKAGNVPDWMKIYNTPLTEATTSVKGKEKETTPVIVHEQQEEEEIIETPESVSSTLPASVEDDLIRLPSHYKISQDKWIESEKLDRKWTKTEYNKRYTKIYWELKGVYKHNDDNDAIQYTASWLAHQKGENHGAYLTAWDKSAERKRNKKKAHAIDFQDNFAIHAVDTTGAVPNTRKQALNRPDKEQWEKAMDAEYLSLIENDTWELVPLPKGRTAIRGRWVYALKEDGRYKARYVAKGFTQVQGIDYNEIFAPVCRYESIRTLLALAAINDWEIHSMDVKTAFLNGELEEEIYMEQPDGYELPGSENLVCRLVKALYGLKQAPRQWHKKIDATLTKFGMQKLISDAGIYHLQEGYTILILILYVDDITIMTNNKAKMAHLKKVLSSNYDMKDLGEITTFLGMTITRNRKERTIQVDQIDYIKNFLKRFGMDNCNPVMTPVAAGTSLVREGDYVDMKMITWYQQAIGSLMYAMICTRPDIAYAVIKLSQFMTRPTTQHVQAVKHLFRYVAGTKNASIKYNGNYKESIMGFSDSDWAENKDDRKSVTGYCFTLALGPVTWASRRQTTVALSSVEAEYMALTETIRQAKWHKHFMSELNIVDERYFRIPIFMDSQGAQALAENDIQGRRSKHIDIRYHYIRDEISQGHVKLSHIDSASNLADGFTKPLNGQKQQTFIKGLKLLR